MAQTQDLHAADTAPTSVGNPKRICVLGSTGSIGVNTLDLLRFAAERGEQNVEVVALTANSNVALLAEQCRAFRPEFAAIADAAKLEELRAALDGLEIEIGGGPEAVVEAANRDSDWVMSAIVGAAGLPGTLAAAERGAAVALANKEALVCAGDVVKAAVARSGGMLLPVDSEHNAIFQVYDFERPHRISKLILTASGGPFRTADIETMRRATPAEAVKHPNWSMGAKISVDSASMMNKGLELIEATHLFPTPEEQIEILVHPQSVIHSMVEYVDGSTLAQLGSPDMRTPIASCLAWPDRTPSPSPTLDLVEIGQLTFEAPDPVRFPAIRLAREAAKAGGTAPGVLNAANEIAVEAFLKERVGFLDIAAIVEETLAATPAGELTSLDDAMAADAAARASARSIVEKRAQ